jgi:hypothetical protein
MLAQLHNLFRGTDASVPGTVARRCALRSAAQRCLSDGYFTDDSRTICIRELVPRWLLYIAEQCCVDVNV